MIKKMTALQHKLTKMDACTEAVKWCGQFKGRNQIQQAWDVCTRSDWMLWLLVNTNYNNKRNLQLIACDCAESVLPNYESAYPDDDRPRKAIQAARDYIDNKITKEELQAARLAARSAESAARSARSARSAAELAWLAAESARSAAWSAWSAARSARSAAWSAAWSARSARSAAESAAESARLAAWSAAELAWLAAESTQADIIRKYIPNVRFLQTERRW